MFQLNFYGGINEIGGNKILLEDGDRSLLLDFGFPYGRHKLFYEEFLKPRSGAGLVDPLTMGLLPPVKGIYRDDYETQDLWNQYKENPLYKEVNNVTGVLLTHAHLDHSAHIAFLNTSIPVYSTAMTAFLTKAIQDSGKADFDQQVCYFTPTSVECPAGWKQKAHLASGTAKQQRRFYICEEELNSLSPAARQFWEFGFWEKTAKQKDMISPEMGKHSGCSFKIRCFPVDHSIPGACAWGIETSAGWVVYSGDLRLHGKRRGLTEKFMIETAKLKPRIMILEGTNVRRDTNITENMVYENGLAAISKAKGLVIADFSPRDLDRLSTFLQIAKATGRKLVILARDAYMLRTARLIDSTIPDVLTDSDLMIYQDTTASKSPAIWMRNIYADYIDKIVLADDVKKRYAELILCFSFFDLNELPSIGRIPDSLYVFSSSEPHDEEQEIDFRRLHKWLTHFKITGFGLPVESNGEWEIPEEERGLHASGHACGTDLVNIVNEIKPQILVPVHSQYPEFYVEAFRKSDIKIIKPQIGMPIAV